MRCTEPVPIDACSDCCVGHDEVVSGRPVTCTELGFCFVFQQQSPSLRASPSSVPLSRDVIRSRNDRVRVRFATSLPCVSVDTIAAAAPAADAPVPLPVRATLVVPSAAVGRVIGKGGSVIRSLSATAGIRSICLTLVDKAMPGGDKEATILGEAEPVAQVLAAMEKLIQTALAPPSVAAASSQAASSTTAPHVTHILDVPSCAAGFLIGKDHSSLRAWQSTPGIKSITIQKATANRNHGSIATIVGEARAADSVLCDFRKIIAVAERSLFNGSRQLHSNVHKAGRPDSFLRSSAQVHKRATVAKPKSGYLAQKQRDKDHQDNLAEKYAREHRDQ